MIKEIYVTIYATNDSSCRFAIRKNHNLPTFNHHIMVRLYLEHDRHEVLMDWLISSLSVLIHNLPDGSESVSSGSHKPKDLYSQEEVTT